jgi:hypothetical protein
MRHLFTSILLLVASFYLKAQTEQVAIGTFKVVYVYGPFKVNFIKSTTCRMEIDYNGIEKEEIIIKSKDEDLHIKLRNRSFFDFNNNSWESKNSRYAHVTIYYTNLEAIEARAGARIRSSETIVSKEIFLVSKMGADMRLDINTQKLELDSSMGSEVNLTGMAEKVEIRSKMGSHVDASSLKSQHVNVSSSMGSDVSIFAEQELNAFADFGGSITYKGNPSMKHTSTFLGADVHRIKN